MLLNIMWGVVFLTLAVCMVAMFIPPLRDRYTRFFSWISGMNVLLVTILIVYMFITQGYLT